jgi:hypothetical protein
MLVAYIYYVLLQSRYTENIIVFFLCLQSLLAFFFNFDLVIYVTLVLEEKFVES